MKSLARLFVVSLVFVAGLNTGAALADEKQPPPFKTIVVYDQALEDEPSDDVLAAWMGYGLARANWIRDRFSEGKLDINAYQLTFEEDLRARETLAKIWKELKETAPGNKDPYLDAVATVYDAGYLSEYVWVYLKKDNWNKQPQGLKLDEFAKWRKKNLALHQARTLVNIRLEKN